MNQTQSIRNYLNTYLPQDSPSRQGLEEADTATLIRIYMQEFKPDVNGAASFLSRALADEQAQSMEVRNMWTLEEALTKELWKGNSND